VSRYRSRAPIGRTGAAGLGATLGSLLVLAAASAAAAQGPGEGPGPPAAAGAPTVVVAPRDLRMNLARVIVLRIGCLGAGAGCGGRLEARLARPVVVRGRRWAPFTLGRGGLGVGPGQSRVMRLRFYPLGAHLVRLAGTIPVMIVARTPQGIFRKTIHVYVSPRQKLG
jgi:hypothetical protein